MNKKLVLRHSLISALVLFCTSSFAVRPIDRCEGALGVQSQSRDSTLKVGDFLDVYKLGFTNGLALGQLRGNGKTYPEVAYGSNGKRTDLSNSFINEQHIVGVFHNQLCLVDVINGQVRYVFPNSELPADSRNQFGPMIGPDKDLAIFVIDRQIRFYSLKNERWVRSVLITSSFADEITSNVKLSNDGERIYWMGSKGTMKIISTLSDAYVHFETQIPSEGMLDVKGHRPHVIESEDGRYVFFVNYDLGTAETASSFLYDLKDQKIIPPPAKKSFLSYFRKSTERDQFFAGVTSAIFSGDRLVVEMGENGDGSVSTGVHYEARFGRELDLKTGQWIIPTYASEAVRFARIRGGFTDRIWGLFTSSLGFRVKELSVVRSSNAIFGSFESLEPGQLPYIKVTEEATGAPVALDLDEISLAHFTSSGVMFDPSKFVFRGVYDADFAVKSGFARGSGRFRRDPEIEKAHFEAFKNNQTSWFVLDLLSKKVQRIVMSDFDQLAVDNPNKAKALNLVGISPDFKRLIFIDESLKWVSFEVSSPNFVFREQ